MTQLTIMMIEPDVARADVLLKEDRIYYHYATEDTNDDGDLPGLQDRFTAVTQRILDALKPLPDEKPLEAADFKLSIFVDNSVKQIKPLTKEAVKRLISQLSDIDDIFAQCEYLFPTVNLLA